MSLFDLKIGRRIARNILASDAGHVQFSLHAGRDSHDKKRSITVFVTPDDEVFVRPLLDTVRRRGAAWQREVARVQRDTVPMLEALRASGAPFSGSYHLEAMYADALKHSEHPREIPQDEWHDWLLTAPPRAIALVTFRNPETKQDETLPIQLGKLWTEADESAALSRRDWWSTRQAMTERKAVSGQLQAKQTAELHFVKRRNKDPEFRLHMDLADQTGYVRAWCLDLKKIEA